MPRANIHPAVKGLVGGSKQHWLRLHRNEVLAYAGEHGADIAREYFAMNKDTFERFLAANKLGKGAHLSTSERALSISQSAIEIARENRHELYRVSERMDSLEPIAKIARALLSAVADSVIEEIKREKLAMANFGKVDENS